MHQSPRRCLCRCRHLDVAGRHIVCPYLAHPPHQPSPPNTSRPFLSENIYKKTTPRLCSVCVALSPLLVATRFLVSRRVGVGGWFVTVNTRRLYDKKAVIYCADKDRWYGEGGGVGVGFALIHTIVGITTRGEILAQSVCRCKAYILLCVCDGGVRRGRGRRCPYHGLTHIAMCGDLVIYERTHHRSKSENCANVAKLSLSGRQRKKGVSRKSGGGGCMQLICHSFYSTLWFAFCA